MKTEMYKKLDKSANRRLFLPSKNWYNPYTWYDNIHWFFLSFRYAAQRIKRGYSDYDLYDFGTYMTALAARALEDFREKTQGNPTFLTEEEWKRMLQVAYGNLYLSLEELTELNYNLPQFPGKLKFVDNGDHTFKIEYEGMTEEEVVEWMKKLDEIEAEQDKCGEEGWNWFAKYYQHLWW